MLFAVIFILTVTDEINPQSPVLELFRAGEPYPMGNLSMYLSYTYSVQTP